MREQQYNTWIHLGKNKLEIRTLGGETCHKGKKLKGAVCRDERHYSVGYVS